VLFLPSLFINQGKTAMPGMKRDCGGAAGILGAFYAAVKQGIITLIYLVLLYKISFSTIMSQCILIFYNKNFHFPRI
jgi:hypothetical protein